MIPIEKIANDYADKRLISCQINRTVYDASAKEFTHSDLIRAFLDGHNATQEAHKEHHAKELQQLIDKFDCDKYHLEKNHQIKIREVMDKCLSDINEFTTKWEASDRKMDVLHLKEMKQLKDYIETILFVIEGADHLCEVKRFVELNKPLSDILITKKQI